MITEAPPSEAARVLDLLAALRRVLGQEVIIEPGGETISTTQFLALRSLANSDRTSSDLARSLGVQLPTLTQLADGLVARGWVQRHGDPADRRRVLLGLTDAGREVYRSARESAEDRMAGILGCLRPAETRSLIRGLTALRQALHGAQVAESGRAKAGRTV